MEKSQMSIIQHCCCQWANVFKGIQQAKAKSYLNKMFEGFSFGDWMFSELLRWKRSNRLCSETKLREDSSSPVGIWRNREGEVLPWLGQSDADFLQYRVIVRLGNMSSTFFTEDPRPRHSWLPANRVGEDCRWEGLGQDLWQQTASA